MVKPTKAAELVNTWAEFGNRVWEICRYLEIDGWLRILALTGIAGAYTVALRIYNSIAWYVILPIALLVGWLALQIFIKFRVAWSLRGVKHFDLTTFAAECLAYHREYMEFLRNRLDAEPRRDSDSDHLRQFEARRELNNRTAVMAAERFSSRAHAILSQMHSLGITTPTSLSFYMSDGGYPVYIGSVGELLSRGLLDEARKMHPRMIHMSGIS